VLPEWLGMRLSSRTSSGHARGRQRDKNRRPVRPPHQGRMTTIFFGVVYNSSYGTVVTEVVESRFGVDRCRRGAGHGLQRSNLDASRMPWRTKRLERDSQPGDTSITASNNLPDGRFWWLARAPVAHTRRLREIGLGGIVVLFVNASSRAMSFKPSRHLDYRSGNPVSLPESKLE
jgi:hypothetical protein